ncbi:MAG: branched-chain amino acid ABC transporter permease [Geminicoccaceae bacterium]
MLYRETGQFKTSYAADQALFRIRQDRIGIALILAVAWIALPLLGSEYFLRAIMTPFLILSLAAIGLNLLLGYCGQISLGTGAFMAVGAYAAYNLALRLPALPLVVDILLAGGIAALVGILFGIPSLRIKGLYLAVATLAAQFFMDWLFSRVAWLTNDTPSGSVTAPELRFFGWLVDTDREKYLVCLAFVCVFAWLAKNLVRSRTGRAWMAIRDMDIAAEIIGIRPLTAKLSAFAVSSFVAGVAGALWAFVYLGSWEPLAFSVTMSFNLLFMCIIGGLGSILGAFLGAGFITILPLVLSQAPAAIGFPLSVATVAHLEAIIFGALIVFFLIVEPHGLARLWTTVKEKLRRWPFPY